MTDIHFAEHATKLPTPEAHAHTSTHPKYRPDIDGLRAVAVLSVLLFHGFPTILKGGFVGVDIFFVISGFLISTIIFNGLRQGVFSFSEFYARRVKRIYPSLLTVMVFVLCWGWFTLYDAEYAQLGKHIVGGAGFVANLVLLFESNYFDLGAESKPLLHLWSLGIEEQFYFFWPLILWFSYKRRWNLAGVTILVAALSFAWNVLSIGNDPTVTFYAPHTRFWELLAGSLLAYLSLGKQSLAEAAFARKDRQLAAGNAMSVLGLALLAAAVLLTDKQKEFPGWWALLPVAGAFLVIGAGPQALLNRWLLANPLARWFGIISFPLYLWHWPLLAFARVSVGQTPPRMTRALLLLLAVLLAWLTYKLIETPLRFGKLGKRTTAVLMSVMVLLAGVGYAAFATKGFAGARLSFQGEGVQEFADYFENTVPGFHYYDQVGLYAKYRDECNFYDLANLRKGRETRAPLTAIAPACYTRDPAKPKAVFIWGDSEAQQLFHGLSKNLPQDWQILQVATSGCAPDPTMTQPVPLNYCTKSNSFAMNSIAGNKPDVVLVAQLVPRSQQMMADIAVKLKGMGVGQVIFIGQSPEWTTGLPGIVTRKLWNNTPRRTRIGLDEGVQKNDALMRDTFKPAERVHFVSLIDFFCNQEGCMTYIGDDRRDGLTSYDVHHLTPSASDYLAKNLLVKTILEADQAK